MAAPLIVTVTPTDASTDVAIDVQPTVTFSTALLAASVHEGTFYITESSTSSPISVLLKLNTAGTKVTIIPMSELLEETTYDLIIIGADDGLGEAVQNTDSVNLAAGSATSFTTKKEKYVNLEKVTTPSDYEGVGPIREEDELDGSGTGSSFLTLDSITPKEFTPEVSIDLNDIEVKFEQTVDIISGGTALEVSYVNAIGLDRYDAATIPDPTGKKTFRLTLCDATGVLADTFKAATGTVTRTADGKGFHWEKSNVPFFFNQEVQVKISGTDITGSSGQTLLDNEDVYFTFSTEFFKPYSKVRAIRLKMRGAVAHLWDDYINRVILDRSIQAFIMAGWTISKVDCAPEAVYCYALWGSIIDLFDALTAQDLSSLGEERTLGDLTVKHKSKGFDPESLSLYKKALKEFEDADFELARMRGSTQASTPVKGSESSSERQDYFMRHWRLVDANLPITNSAAMRGIMQARETDHVSGVTRSFTVDGLVTMGKTIIYLKDGSKRIIINSC